MSPRLSSVQRWGCQFRASTSEGEATRDIDDDLVRAVSDGDLRIGRCIDARRIGAVNTRCGIGDIVEARATSGLDRHRR